MKKDRGNQIQFQNIMRLRECSVGEIRLEVGRHYWLGRRFVRFIKVTRKGFNFLDESTNHCVLRRHIYVKGAVSFYFLPPNQKKFTFRMNANIVVNKVADAM